MPFLFSENIQIYQGFYDKVTHTFSLETLLNRIYIGTYVQSLILNLTYLYF